MRTTGARDAVGAIAVILALAFGLRFIIAYILPGSGFGVDLNAFRFWASDLAQNGPWGFYDRPFFHDYTPGYLYVLWLVGTVERVLPTLDLIKVPAILADLAVGWLIWSMALELGASRRKAVLGAALYLFIPVTWFDSVVWGQVDSVGLVFLLLGLRELWRDRPERATALAVVAAIVKPQLGILVPIAAAVLLRRYLVDRPPLRDLRRGPARLLSSGAAGLTTAVLLCAPFRFSILDLIAQVQKTAGGYPYLTLNAYNPWALVTSAAGSGLAQSGQWLCDAVTGSGANTPCPPGSETLIGPLPAVVVGTAIFLIVVTIVVGIVMWRPDRLTMLVGLTVLAVAFFVLPTRVHERYLFPFFALAAILAAFSTRWRVTYLVVGAATFLNLYVVLTTLYQNNPGISDWFGIGPAIRSWSGVAAIAAVFSLAFVWVAIQLRPGGRRALERELDAGIDGPVERPVARPVAAGQLLPAVAGSSPRTSANSSAAGQTPRGVDPARSSWFGPLGALRGRLGAPSLRADRSRALAGEIGGRLDRLDLWLVVVLVVAATVFRMWRLGEPTSMHFDEVYHARTATEFLQDWRYGEPHAIYEFTHPHLAKYAIALGIIAWGDDRTTAASDLGVPVRDVAIETRWDDPLLPDHRAGDRLYVATGSAVRVYDLQTRAVVATIPSPGASLLAVDQAGHRLFIGSTDGSLTEIDTSPAFDAVRRGADIRSIGPPIAFGSFGTSIRRLVATDDGAFVVALSTAGDVVSMDGGSGAILGSVAAPGAVDIASAGTSQGLVADLGAVPDPSAAATTLAALLGSDAATLRSRLVGHTGRVVLGGSFDPTVQAKVQAAITDGRLAGFSFSQLAEVAVADTQGVTIVSPADASVDAEVPIAGGATGLALTAGLDAPRLYVAAGSSVTVIKLPASSDASGQPVVETSIPMPGPVSRVTFDPASVMVHVLGLTPDRTTNTIYVIEPHGNAVYADAHLPFAPVAWATDVEPLYPSTDRQAILALDASGAVASVDIGNHEFSWRVPGVIAGSLTAGLLFLLTRILFRRRTVGVLVAIFSLVDGMFFVQSRIAMNDVYVGLFLMAAYVVFAGLWLGIWRRRWAFWVAMPAIGVLLGLGLASKWVAAYAIAAVGLLVLLRSALGRVLAIVGMVAVTIVLGYMGLATSVPEAGQTASSGANFLFMFLMMGLTLIAVVVAILHPIAWSREEMWFAVGAPTVAGVALGLGGIALAARGGPSSTAPSAVGFETGLAGRAIEAGIAALLLAGLIVVAFRFAGRYGFGPLAEPPAPDDPARFLEPPAPAPLGWLRPGSAYGLPVVWMLLCILVLPIAVYVVSYIPWALNSGGPAGSPVIFPAGTPLVGAWPPGHTGQTLVDLTKSMYAYHNDLRATHPASSPWWAWPFDLKPVWFYQGGFAGNTSAAIYDAGNLVTWWLGVPAMAFVVWQSFKRRSPGLALIAIAFAFQWLSWARIDRATFEYHYYTSVPFVIVALAYLLAELWHGASSRTWLLARVSAAVAIMGPGLLWVLKAPLCAFVGVDRANPGSQACTGDPATIVVTARTAGLLLVVGIGLVALAYQLAHLEAVDDGRARPRRRGGVGSLLLTAVGATVALVVVGATFGNAVLVNLQAFSTAPLAIGALVVLACVAWFIAGARDPRRFVVGAVIAGVAEFLVVYPNIAALPLPSTIFNAYQGILPTYLYPFQFPTNTDPPATAPSLFAPDRSFLGLPPGPVLLLFLTIACLVVAYSAWTWRIALAERSAAATDEADTPARSG
ncbi:MAG: phospholipid carrier-dependent glycosyltransferase [Chloroflexi bacterium]|nr:phospholipid carrier-dependent glycosyltransferase [Chloroflexota bacterium]